MRLPTIGLACSFLVLLVLSSVTAWGSTPVLPGSASVLAYDSTASTAQNLAFKASRTPILAGQFVSNFGGSVRAIEATGEMAYVGEGRALSIFDVRDRTRPRRLASVPLPWDVEEIQIVGDIAYVAAGDLQIVDIRDPLRPVLLGSYPVDQVAYGLQVVGGFVYVAALDLHVFDARDPRRLRHIASYKPGVYIYDVFVADNLAYVVGSDQLEIVDVQDPEHLQLLGVYNALIQAEDVWVEEKVAYVADRIRALQIIDVSRPNHPRRLGSYGYDPTAELASLRVTDVQVVRERAYLTTSGEGLHVLDVREPANPVLLGEYGAVVGRDVSVDGQLVYVANSFQGFSIFETGSDGQPQPLGHYRPPLQRPEGVHLVEDKLYMAADGGLAIVDVSTPATPTILGRWRGRSEYEITWHVQVVGSRAYLGTGSEIYILDVGDPANPRLLGTVLQAYQDFHVEGDRLYIAYGSASTTPITGDVRIFDVSQPHNVSMLGDYTTSTFPAAIRGAGEWVYLVDKIIECTEPDCPVHLSILDVTDPASPALRRRIELERPPARMEVVGQRIYLADWAGITIMDASNPANPAPLSRYENRRSAWSRVVIEVENDLVYLLTDLRIVEIVDVTDPAAPRLRGTVEAPSLTADIEVGDDFLYLSRDNSGLLTMRIVPMDNSTFLPLLRGQP